MKNTREKFQCLFQDLKNRFTVKPVTGKIMNKLYLTMFLLFSIFIFLSSSQKHTSVKQIEVKINSNIETIACLYNLTRKGAEMGYGYGSVPFRKKVMKQFSHLKNHNAVNKTAEFLDRGLWATPVWVALNSAPFPEGKLLYELPQWIYETASSGKSVKDGKQRINAYIESVNDFYRKARFGDFIKKNEKQYRNTEEEVRRNLPDKYFVTTMEQYYGKKHINYTLVPSPVMLEFAGFGAAITTEEGLMVFNIFGASIKKDVKDSIEAGSRKFNTSDYTFNDPERIRELTVHEFGHSFVNSVAEKYHDEINRYNYLYEPIRGRMTELSYLDWWNCAVEHIVRAGEIRIAVAMGQKESAKRLEQDYVNKYKFIYLQEVIESMKIYEQNRVEFKSFDEYFPELLKAFGNIDPSESQEIQ